MATRKVQTLPPELTEILFKLGPRKLVLLEGDDDVEVFREWYRHSLNQLEFHPSGGHGNVRAYLAQIKRAYGIIDRDFRTEAEVEQSLNDLPSRLFILRRYATENYLLEPEALWEELRLIDEKITPHITDLTQVLLQLCHQFKSIMAAHWLFSDKHIAMGQATIEYFSIGFPTDNRPLLLTQTAQKLGCSIEDAQAQIEQKEQLLDSYLNKLDTAYQVIDGKRLFGKIFPEFKIPTAKDHFRRLLARATREKGLHADIKYIIEQRILDLTH